MLTCRKPIYLTQYTKAEHARDGTKATTPVFLPTGPQIIRINYYLELREKPQYGASGVCEFSAALDYGPPNIISSVGSSARKK